MRIALKQQTKSPQLHHGEARDATREPRESGLRCNRISVQKGRSMMMLRMKPQIKLHQATVLRNAFFSRHYHDLSNKEKRKAVRQVSFQLPENAGEA